jgi:predicted amidophosphoribosyltransferase
VVRKVDITSRSANVRARLLAYSVDNRNPLIHASGNGELLDRIRTRRRGAELIVPDDCEQAVYRLLSSVDEISSAAARRNVSLPGAKPPPLSSVSDVPLVELGNELSSGLQEKAAVTAYWIRPSRASWIGRAPYWLSYITRVFNRFKAGDVSRIDVLADGLAAQIRNVFPDVTYRFGVIVGVPLNEEKRSEGEVDRVAQLAQALSDRIDVPASSPLVQEAGISRRRYKLEGSYDWEFRRDYLASLRVRHTKQLMKCLRAGEDILILDDVYTDGLTMETIIQGLEREFPNRRLSLKVAALGVMAKHRNMDSDLIESWR